MLSRRCAHGSVIFVPLQTAVNTLLGNGGMETAKYAYTAEVRGKFLASKQLNVGSAVLQIYISLKKKFQTATVF